MQVDVFSDAETVAQAGATRIAEAAREAIVARDQFTLAVSGGHTPWIMLAMLAKEDLPWEKIAVFQVDERVAATDSPDRNLFHLRQSLLSRVPIAAANVHAMPVDAPDLDAGAAAYARTLEAMAGAPPRLDLVHLGLGPDGHTASLVPDDPVLGVRDRWVATTLPYQGHPRMTLTYPVLDNAAEILFVVTGAEKVDALKKLQRHDPAIPAGRLTAPNMTVMADKAATGGNDDG
ncbi:MAG: 6-phosphogluconolactonase [Bauldia sp.]|nr:6-phosphogluconolactonase [Bauldia sp.]